jgi:hypothetical protein
MTKQDAAHVYGEAVEQFNRERLGRPFMENIINTLMEREGLTFKDEQPRMDDEQD